MGRFYKATPGKFIDDKMFQLNPETMMKAISTVDKNITSVYEMGDKSTDLLKSDSLNVDDKAVRDRIRYHQGKVDAVGEAMNNDILGYKKHGATMRGISRDISSDLNSGIFSATEGNLKDYNEWKLEVDKDDSLTPDERELKKDYSLFMFEQGGGTAYDQETGASRNFLDSEQQFGGDIEDEDKYITNILTNFDYDITELRKKGIGISSATPFKYDGANAVKTIVNTEMERSDADVRGYVTNSLDSMNYQEGRTKMHEANIRMGREELQVDPLSGKELNVEESAEKLGQDDYNSLVEATIRKGVKKRGDIRVSYSGIGGSGGSSGAPVKAENVINTFEDNIPEVKARTSESTSRFNDIFDTIEPVGPVQGISGPGGLTAEQNQVQNDIALAKKAGLNALGFSSTREIFSKSNIAYGTTEGRENLKQAFIIMDSDFATKTTLQQNQLMAEWMTVENNKTTREQPINTFKKPYAELDKQETITANKQHKAAVITFNSVDEGQDIFTEVYSTNDLGETIKVDAQSVNDLEKLGYIYVKPTGSVPGEKAYDETTVMFNGKNVLAYKDTKGNPVLYDQNFPDMNPPRYKGEPVLDADYARELNRPFQKMTAPVKKVTNTGEKFLQATTENYLMWKQTTFFPDGSKLPKNSYVYKHKYYKVDGEGKRAYFNMRMHANIDNFPIN